MIFSNLLDKVNSEFHVSIGDEGATFIFVMEGVIKSKFFIKSTDPTDTDKIREVLVRNKDALIYLYIDTLDQSYVQRSLPGISQFNVAKIANTRLEKEVPKSHIKTAIQVGKQIDGRNDWIYTFISSPIEPPVSLWLEFFSKFSNIIQGIYFLPIELWMVVDRIKKSERKSDPIAKSKRLSFSFKREELIATKSSWDIIITHNKTGGFRQAAFENGKIVFSRLINNITDPDPDVVAGNIEQEIANSVEYLSRLSIGKDAETTLYLVIANDVQQYLRKEKIKVANIKVYSPLALANKLGLSDIAGDKDRYCDPVLLYAFSRLRKHLVKLHTDETKKISLYTSVINMIGKAAVISLPILLISTAGLFNNIVGSKISIADIKKQIESLNVQITEGRKIISSNESKIPEKLAIEHLNEIMRFHKLLSKNTVSPLQSAGRFGTIKPDFSVAESFKWSFAEQNLLNAKNPAKGASLYQVEKKFDYRLDVEMNIKISDFQKNFDVLSQYYTEFNDIVKNEFDDLDVNLSEMPSNFTFDSLPEYINVPLKLHYPKKIEKKG